MLPPLRSGSGHRLSISACNYVNNLNPKPQQGTGMAPTEALAQVASHTRAAVDILGFRVLCRSRFQRRRDVRS